MLAGKEDLEAENLRRIVRVRVAGLARDAGPRPANTAGSNINSVDASVVNCPHKRPGRSASRSIDQPSAKPNGAQRDSNPNRIGLKNPPVPSHENPPEHQDNPLPLTGEESQRTKEQQTQAIQKKLDQPRTEIGMTKQEGE